MIIYRPTSAQFRGCFMSTGCGAAIAVTATSAEDCCINIDKGLYYLDGTTCQQCNTFGWIQNTLEGDEQANPHTVQAGYSKGGGTTVSVHVELVQDPQASFHANTSDFGGSILISPIPIVVGATPTNVPITLAVNNVANEGIERGILRMRISEDSTQPPNTFFKRDLGLVINDTTTVTIGFTNVLYASSESKEAITTSVWKTQTQLAHPVSLRVQPMTIDEALAMGFTIPTVDGVNIIVNNTAERMRVPVRAKGGGVDFSTDAIDITLPADEGASLVLQIDAKVAIVDDQIDEADREYFILRPSLTSSSPSVFLDDSVSVGIIADDDVLQISFERSNYTYMEPEGFDTNFVEDIYMVKNIKTELTYKILFQIIAGDATQNEDYDTSLARFGSVRDISPNQQRLQLFDRIFIFEILPDALPEGEETVQISSEPINHPPPAYTRPQRQAVTTIHILDDNNITVGWDQTSYTVSEGVGTFQAFYSVISPPNTHSLAASLLMRVRTVRGTAGEQDYQSIHSQGQLLNNHVRRASVNVTIRTDSELEGVEQFSLELSLASPQTEFFVRPNIATVTILDAIIEVTVGFTGAPYRAKENLGPMIFTVAVNVIGNATLTTDVVVSFSTVDGSILGRKAVVGSDYAGRSNMLLTFNATIRRIEVSVDVIDDSVFEGDEDFIGTLTLVSDSQRVAIDHGSAVATIVDDETIECRPLLSIANGFIRYAPDNMPNYALGTVATYSCNAGYILDLSVGSASRTCRDDDNAVDMIGVFDGQAPTCTTVCQTLAPLVNGRIEYSPDTTAPYLVGTRATHTCNSGLVLNGTATRTCQNNSFFDGTPPTCEFVDCGPLSDPDNGQVDTSNGTTFGNTATYTCHKESGSRTCGVDGLWTSTEPNCQETELSAPANDQAHDISAIVVGVILIIVLVISMVIIALLSGYIVHLKKKQKLNTRVQHLNKKTGSTAYELVEKASTQYEDVDTLRQQMDTRKQSNPPKGDYELTQCAAYGPVHPN